MSLLGHPNIPPGGRAFVSQDDIDGHEWSVRVAMDGEDPLPTCERISPRFTLQTTAYAWLDSDEVTPGGPKFVYPAGAA